MSSESEKPYLLVAAIDLGTTYSGYGLSFTGKETSIVLPINWGAAMSFLSYKTPTSVLVDQYGKFKAFGYDAQTEYGDAMGVHAEDDDEKSKVSELHLFKHFKMELHGKERIDKSMTIKATDGFELAAIDVFAMALNYLQGHLIDTVNDQQASTLRAGQVRWVLTVPAIWSEVAKTFMKEAAVQGKLVGSAHSSNLVIALEPEAASLYCRTKEIATFVGNGSEKGLKQEKGDRYMIVDAGGGTMDITVHEVLEDDRVKEITKASGGKWGGIYVDKELEALYDEVFGTEIMEQFRNQYPIVWGQMMIDWETKKKSTSPSSTRSVNLSITSVFSDFLERRSGRNIQALVADKTNSGMSFAKGFLRVSNEKVNGMFEAVLKPAMDHLHQLLSNKKIDEIKCIFVVGGFGESVFLQQRIKDEFETPTRSVLCPTDASLCVIKGAVLFGHNPQTISSRIARRTFCFRTTMPREKAEENGIEFKPSQLIDNGKRVRYLKPMVLVDDELNDGDVKSKITKPVYKSSTSLQFKIYTSKSKEVCDPEAVNVHELGDVVIGVDPKLDIDDNEIELMMKFGGTSLTVTAMHRKTGSMVQTEFSRPDAQI